MTFSAFALYALTHSRSRDLHSVQADPAKKGCASLQPPRASVTLQVPVACAEVQWSCVKLPARLQEIEQLVCKVFDSALQKNGVSKPGAGQQPMQAGALHSLHIRPRSGSGSAWLRACTRRPARPCRVRKGCTARRELCISCTPAFADSTCLGMPCLSSRLCPVSCKAHRPCNGVLFTGSQGLFTAQEPVAAQPASPEGRVLAG